MYFNAQNPVQLSEISDLDMLCNCNLEAVNQKLWCCDDCAIINMDQNYNKGSPFSLVEHCLISVWKSGPVRSFGLERPGPRLRPIFTGSKTAKDRTRPMQTGLMWSWAVNRPVSTSYSWDWFNNQSWPVVNQSWPVVNQSWPVVNRS
jgi:hypothetical protein